MTGIRRIIDLYDLYGFYKKVTRERGISRKILRDKYVLRVKDVQNGTDDEILLNDRRITRPSRVLTETGLQKTHKYEYAFCQVRKSYSESISDQLSQLPKLFR